MSNMRKDPFTQTVVHIVGSRQNRPNLPSQDCPFCVGGLEAPEPYVVRAFPNRWPALGEGYCEVVLYTPEHDATFASLSESHMMSVIDLWIERTTALRQLPDGEHVVIFENRGAEIGATISHPHGQIYAFDHVPERQARHISAHWSPEPEPGDRLILEHNQWRVWAEFASVHPISLRIAPTFEVSDLADVSREAQQHLATVLKRVFTALERLFDQPLPYMMWINQAPRTKEEWPVSWLNFEIVSPWRASKLPRYIAAVEVASGEYFNPVDPADVAARLRALIQ